MRKQIDEKIAAIISPITRLKMQTHLKELLQSTNFQDWLYLDAIINKKSSSKDTQFLKSLEHMIIQPSLQIRSFPMFVFIYSLQIDDRLNLKGVDWQEVYKRICLFDNQLEIFNAWAANDESRHQNYNFIQNTLQIIAKVYPSFVKQYRFKLQKIESESLLKWILWMKTQTASKFELSENLSNCLKEKQYFDNEFIKQFMINLGNDYNNSGNAFLILNPETFSDKNVEYFCNIYRDFLLDLNENHLANIFINLVAGGITIEALTIIYKFTCLLRQQEEFFELRVIYERFIIPVLCLFKTHELFGHDVYGICEIYVMGFLKHCHMDKDTMSYLYDSVEKISEKDVQQKWLKMMFFVSNHYECQEQFRQYLKAHSIESSKFEKIEELTQNHYQSMIWQITLRVGRKHKRYIKIRSSEKGIKNKKNQCFVISVVQALYMTSSLKGVLDEYRTQIKHKLKILDELRMLFYELSHVRNKDLIVTYLKAFSPTFGKSHQQHDASEYLIQLLDLMLTEAKKSPRLQSRLNQLFEINCDSTVQCLSCGRKTHKKENQMVHTIQHTQILRLREEEQLQSFACSECKTSNTKAKIVRTLSPECQIFIVHINRFRFKGSKMVKEMSNQTILRKFKNYQLVGMVCHIGESVNNGHYIYYSKVNSNKWVEMNDNQTFEFELETEDEEFEIEMGKNLSPYILFYKRLK